MNLKMKLKKFTLSIFALLIISILMAPAVFAAENEYQEKVKITMSFAGDCTLGSDFKYGESGSFVEMYNKLKDPSYFLSAVAPIFQQDDLTIVNLEGPLTKSGQKASKEFAFKGDPEYTGILTSGSVEIVNLANNHTYDYGTQGYNDTISSLGSAQIGSFGLNKQYITERNGIKAGFLGYTAWSFDSSAENKIKADIKSLRDQGADVVVVSMHGGVEGSNSPNAAQKGVAKCAIDNGADLVIGHHPHVIQGLELYKGKYIVYSLGNFCFGGNRNPSDKDTFIFRQTFEFDKATMQITGSNATIYPCSVSSVKTKNDFKPTPLLGDEANRVINRLVSFSNPLNNYADIVTGLFYENQPVQPVEEIDPSGFKSASSLKLLLFGNEINFETPPLTKEDITYVPAVEFFEKSGAVVEYDSEKLNLTVQNGNDKLIFKVNGSAYEKWTYAPERNERGELVLIEINTVPADFSPLIHKDNIYISLRDAAGALGYSVEWDAAAKGIYIN